MFGYASGVWNDKRARPGDDLASALVTAEVDGHRLDETDFSLFFLLLLVDAGGDTTRNLVGGGMDALFAHPAERARLTADLGLLPGAIEEMLRWTSPVIYMRRTATAGTGLGGRKIEAGQTEWLPSTFISGPRHIRVRPGRS
jgi:cytochrome P450